MKQTELVPAQPVNGAVPPVTESAAVMSAILEASRDERVNVDKLERLLILHQAQKDQEAKGAFNRAMRAAQSEMVAIVRDAENSHTKSRYARLETIDAKIRPIYTGHGFSLSFNSGDAKKPDAVRVICDVMHTDGWTGHYELEADLDTAGAKGTSNKTSIQGLGSSVSYLRRYLTMMIFNLTLTGEDKDGNRSIAFLTEQQVSSIVNLINAYEGGPAFESRFLRFMGTETVTEIHQRDYQKAVDKLQEKLAEKRKV